MALDINTAGCEFVKSILKLYKSAKYFREKEILARKLLDSSVEAGSLITELGVCPESKEDAIARNAMQELSKAMFILKIMCAEGIYPQRRVEPVITLSGQIKELVELYYAEENKAPAPAQPAPAPVVPQLAEESSHHDEGGFNEIYTGD